MKFRGITSWFGINNYPIWSRITVNSSRSLWPSTDWLRRQTHSINPAWRAGLSALVWTRSARSETTQFFCKIFTQCIGDKMFLSLMVLLIHSCLYMQYNQKCVWSTLVYFNSSTVISCHVHFKKIFKKVRRCIFKEMAFNITANLLILIWK